ncbi:hypothetical protein B0H21DRAFT_689167 [Amylocystis lapponica]|nr:hypothetical protein B0H21DRAFT_689167 [Amylocystis lapponica]
MADFVFPLTIDDTSPTISYSPFPDTFGVPDVLAGWNPYYTDSGFATDPGPSSSSPVTDIGNGTSLHITALDGAAFAVAWNGTAITVHGTLTAPVLSTLSYSVTLDGTPTTNYVSTLSSPASVTSAVDDVLAAFSNLSDGPHQLVLTVRNPDTDGNTTATGAVVVLDRAVVELEATSPQAPTSTSASQPPAASPTTTSISDYAIAFRGQWSFASTLLPALPNAAFHLSTNAGDSAWIPFNGEYRASVICYMAGHEVNFLERFIFIFCLVLILTPFTFALRCTAVTLSGLTTPSSGLYNVSLDGEPFVTRSARSSFTATVPTVLYYASGLDSTPHMLEVVNAGAKGGDEGSLLAVLAGGANVTSNVSLPTATPVSVSGLSRGQVAAIAIGSTFGFIFLILLVGLLIYWRRRGYREEQLFVRPRTRRTRLMAFFLPGHARAEKADLDANEKAREERRVGAAGHLEVLDITSHDHEKSEDEDDEHEATGVRRADKGKGRARYGHAAQNSDGSFAIELPDLEHVASYSPRQITENLDLPTPLPSLGFFSSPITSPRSPRPRGPREMHGRDSSRGILLSEMGGPMSDEEAQENQTPLRVGFSPIQERPERGAETEKHVSTGAMSLPYSLRQALGRYSDSQRRDDVREVEAGASTSRPSTMFSFLDFSSSSSTLGSRTRSQRQSSSNSTRSSARSRRNTGSEQSARSVVPPERRISFGLSMTVDGGPTESRPSLTPDVSLQPVSLPPPLTIASGTGHGNVGPDAADLLPSPTDSIPLTVSDIHFRHSAYSTSSVSDSRRTSAMRLSGSHRPPHPPLPSSSVPPSPTEATVLSHTRANSLTTRPFIVQKLLGMPGAGSGPPTPFASPTTPGFRSSEPAGPSTLARPAGAGIARGSGTFGQGQARQR